MSLYVAFWSGLAFVWPATLGFVAALTTGVLVSLLSARPTPAQSALTFRSVMSADADSPAARIAAQV